MATATVTNGTVLAEVGELTLIRHYRGGFVIEGEANLDVHDLHLPDQAAAADYAIRVIEAKGVYTGNVTNNGHEGLVHLFTKDYDAAIALINVFIGLLAG